ncbi:MAG: exodeoxyribonuclease VII small subunit [bacterium]
MTTTQDDPQGGAREARGWEQLSMVGDDGDDSVAGEPADAGAAKAKRPARKTARKGGGSMTGGTTGADTAEGGASTKPAGTVAAANDVSLEAALERLEAIVRQLEGGNIDLDKSLALFEEGVGLSRLASKRLGEAETKIAKLVRSLDGGFTTEPFATEADSEGDA